MPRARALINADALRHNLNRVRELAAGSRVMAVVKANGYGHGIATVVEAIGKQVDAFAVATIAEAIECRAVSIQSNLPTLPIVVLSGLESPASLSACEKHNLQPVIHSPAHLDWFAQTGSALDVWLKVDTGMTRLGIAPNQVSDAVAKLRANRRTNHNRGEIRLMSHLANADDVTCDYSHQQLQTFLACAPKNMECSLANSAAIISRRDTHLHWVRPGIMLYGASPLINVFGAELDLQPAMTVEAKVLAIKSIAAGCAIGYGGDYVAKSAMRIAIVGFGYADGYPRTHPCNLRGEVLEVLIGGNARAAVVGRVSMDMLAIDISSSEDFGDVAIGDKVVLWGQGLGMTLGVDEVAARAGTIPHELLCTLGARVVRQTIMP